jgi:glutamine amidotransferase/cyclase
MKRMHELGFFNPLKQYLLENRPFMGICVGMQALYLDSLESSDAAGLGTEHC